MGFPYNILRRVLQPEVTPEADPNSPYPRLPRPAYAAPPEYSGQPAMPVTLPPAFKTPVVDLPRNLTAEQSGQIASIPRPSNLSPAPAPATPADRLSMPFGKPLGETTPANAVIPLRRPQSYGEQAREELGPQKGRGVLRVIGDSLLGLAGGGPLGALAGGISGGDWRYQNRVAQRAGEIGQADAAQRQGRSDALGEEKTRADIARTQAETDAARASTKYIPPILQEGYDTTSGQKRTFRYDEALKDFVPTKLISPNQGMLGKPFSQQEAKAYVLSTWKPKPNPEWDRRAREMGYELDHDPALLATLASNGKSRDEYVRGRLKQEGIVPEIPFEEDPDAQAQMFRLMREGQGQGGFTPAGPGAMQPAAPPSAPAQQPAAPPPQAAPPQPPAAAPQSPYSATGNSTWKSTPPNEQQLAIDAYKANKDRMPGLREEFIKMFGFDPDAPPPQTAQPSVPRDPRLSSPRKKPTGAKFSTEPSMSQTIKDFR